MNKLIETLKKEHADFKLLMRCIPAAVVVFFVMSVVLMNLLANKEIQLNVDWLALDCGFLLSWISFMCMDIVTKRFGPKAAIKLSLFAISVNLVVCMILYVISLVPGNWGVFYTYNNPDINTSINSTIGGTWYVLLGSTIAMASGSIVNALINSTIGKLMKHDSLKAYMIRMYVSTFVGQFIDNMIFAFAVSHVFFGWSTLQCITCSITGCVAELLCEVIFSPFGYRISKQWDVDNVGHEYIRNHT